MSHKDLYMNVHSSIIHYSQEVGATQVYINLGPSLAVQWLRLCAPSAGGTGSIPGQGTKIPHATQCAQRKKKCPSTYKWTECGKSIQWNIMQPIKRNEH